LQALGSRGFPRRASTHCVKNKEKPVGKNLVVELNPPPPKSPVKTSDISGRTTASEAKQKAAEFVRALGTIKPDETAARHTAMWWFATDVYSAVTRDWNSDARNAFMFHLGEKFGGVLAFRTATEEELKALRWVGADDTPFKVASVSDMQAFRWANANKDLPKPYNVLWLPADGVMVLPLSMPIGGPGMSVAYQMQAFVEHSTSKGKEKFVEVYVSTEAKTPGIPLVKNIISIDLKAGVKTGTKTYTKTEVKDAVRSGPQVSKNYTLQKVTRNAVVMARQPHSKWDYLTIEEGWQIIPKEGGKTIGPFWPWYRLDATELPNSAFLKAAGALERELEAAAVEVAKLLPLLQ
jgi:hypothetical protein